jgi:O-antigen/teichoic acid export membrane protein
MSQSRAVAYNSLIQLVGRVAGVILGILTARLLLPALSQPISPGGAVKVIDLYFGVIGYLGLVSTCADVGLTTICTREMARDEAQSGRVLGNALALRILLGLALIPVAIGGAFLVYSEPSKAMLRSGIILAACLIPLQLVSLSLVPVFQVRQQMVWVVIAEMAMRVAQWTAIFALLRTERLSFHTALVVVCLTAGLNLAISLIAASRLIRVRLHFDLPFWRRLVLTALPLGVFGILSSIYLRIDTLMLTKWQPHHVGAYGGVATRVYEYALFIPGVFITSAFPVLAAQIALGRERARASIQRSFDFLVMTGIPVAVGGVLLAPRVVTLFSTGDPAYAAAAIPMQILLIAVAFSFLTSLHAYLLIAIDRQRDAMIVSAVVLTANVLLNLFLIRRWGMIGAASATLATECLSFACLSAFVRWRYGFYPSLGRVPRVFLAAGMMGALLGWSERLQLPLPVLMLLAVVVYGALAFALGVVDREMISSLARRSPLAGKPIVAARNDEELARPETRR